MAEKIAPQWKYTLDLVKHGAMGSFDCQEYQCANRKHE